MINGLSVNADPVIIGSIGLLSDILIIVIFAKRSMEHGSGHRKIGRPKLRWSDDIRKDMKEKQVKKHKTAEHGVRKLDAPTPHRPKKKMIRRF